MKVLPLTMGMSDRTYRFNKCLSFLCIYWNPSNKAEAKSMLQVTRQQHSFVAGMMIAMLSLTDHFIQYLQYSLFMLMYLL